MFRLKLKSLFLFLLMVLLIFSTIQHHQNFILKEYIGKSFSEPVNYLDNEMYNLQMHLSNLNNNRESTENIVKTLSFFANELLEAEMESHNIPSKYTYEERLLWIFIWGPDK